MTRKKKPLVLAKLAEDPRSELESMLNDLAGDRAHASDDAKLSQWARRFSATGKNTCRVAPRIRLS
jgi:hypothetical protein